MSVRRERERGRERERENLGGKKSKIEMNPEEQLHFAGLKYFMRSKSVTALQIKDFKNPVGIVTIPVEHLLDYLKKWEFKSELCCEYVVCLACLCA